LPVWYFNEGVHTFSFLTDKNEIFNFLGTALFIVVLPIGIFYLASEKERYRVNAKKLALLGFMPALMILVFLIL
jgi:lipoprotein signal peptidase